MFLCSIIFCPKENERLSKKLEENNVQQETMDEEFRLIKTVRSINISSTRFIPLNLHQVG